MMSSTKVDPSPSSPSLATRKRKGEEDGTKCIVQDLMTEKAPQPTSSSSKMGESDSSEVVDDPSPSSFSLATKKMKVKKESSGSDHILTADQATATEQSYNSKLEKSKVPAIRKSEYSFTTSKIQPSLVSSPMGGVVPIAAKKVNYPPPKFQFEPTLKSALVHGTDPPLDFNGGIEAAKVSPNQPLPISSAFGPPLVSILQPVWTSTQHLHEEAKGGPEAKEPVVLDNGEAKFCSFLPGSNVFEVDKGAPIFRVSDSIGSNEGIVGPTGFTLNENASKEANSPERPNPGEDVENKHVEEVNMNRVRIGGVVVFRFVKMDGEQKGKYEKVGKGILEVNDEMKGKERKHSTISVRAGTDVFLNSYVVPGMTVKKKSAFSILLSAQDVDGTMQSFVLKASSDDGGEEIETLIAALENRLKKEP